MNRSNSSLSIDAELQSSELVEFADDVQERDGDPTENSWTILLVDDDQDVHSATRMSMQGMQICDRWLHFEHAYTAAQAREFVAQRDDIAVIMLDVVMETEDAGLRLVQQIRDEFGRTTVQIVLRTGQPGFAPEIETIKQYEINDYRTKTELTQVRLYTTLTGAIRTYQHLQSMQGTLRGLEVVVHSITEVSRARGLKNFAEGLITQLCALMHIKPRGIVCEKHGNGPTEEAIVVGAIEIHASLLGQSLMDIGDRSTIEAITRCFKYRANVFDGGTSLYFAATNGQAFVVFLDAESVKEIERHLIRVFCSGMKVVLENTMLNERMFSLAYEDQLLGIANRNCFLDMLQDRLSDPEGTTVALLDIDDFAGDNAMFGHAFGDELLKAFAARLIHMNGPQVDLGRISGDTFALVGRAADVNPQALADCTASLLKVQNQLVTVSATCGLVNLHPGCSDSAEVLKQAYIALKLAKLQHRGASLFYNDAMGTDATERSALLRRLREAFESDRLFVVYQPQVRLLDGKIIGAEALLRWRNEDGNYVSPDQFIPVAEQSGLMISIGEFVLRSACHQLKQINAAGYSSFRMSVNVSQAQFRESGFVNTVKRAIADSGVLACNLELEITESMAAEQLYLVQGILHELKLTGVTIAIDDFGTGYSSLSILRDLPLDRLKIDKSFVDDLGAAESVAKSIIDIGRSLKLEIIAEGVEIQKQAQDLLALGCNEGQGYFYSRPLPPEEFHHWLSQH